MKLHRFIGDYDLSKNEIEIENLENIKQIKGILRLEVGEHLILGDGRGLQAEFSIIDISKEKITCKQEKIIPNTDPVKKIKLHLAILKKENLELAVQKAVECGVSEIVPIITERTVKTGLNIERLNKIIREASEQSGRSTVPKLLEITNFKDAVENSKNESEKIIFDQNGKTYKFRENSKSASIFIGPEGGFTDAEISLAESNGYTVATLGSLVLRAETAVVVTTYLAVNNL